jgi:acyl carrier protein
MKPSREAVLNDILEILQTVSGDWDFETALTADTRLFSDLNFESLDLVVLGSTLQERFGQRFPFPEFFAQIGQREIRDLTIGEWADFVHHHLEERTTVADGASIEPVRGRP